MRGNFTDFLYWGLMSICKTFGLTILAAVCLLGETTGSVQAEFFATEWSGGNVIRLKNLPGSSNSQALSINDAGRAAGISVVNGVDYATEWSGSRRHQSGRLAGLHR
jgi:uncharacterized membrane protein